LTNATRPCRINIVFMGDSIIYGQYIDPKLRWASAITERLARLYLNTAVHIYSLNRGVSGDTTRIGLERFPSDVQNADPDILILQFGLNDCNCWTTDGGLARVSEAAFRANLIEMIARGYCGGAKRIILLSNHRTLRLKVMLSGERYEDANARYSQIICEVGAETGVLFCNIRKAFDPYSISELEKLLLPYPDQIHLSEEGHRVYADVIYPPIADAVEAVIRQKSEKEKSGHEEQY
jgi:lysophospholipase L1-like esterase